MKEYENDFDYSDYRRNDTYGRDYGDSHELDHNALEPQKQDRYTFTRKSLALLLICCIVLSSAFGAGGALLINQFLPGTTYQTFGSPPVRLAPMNVNLAEATGSKLSIQEIIDIAADAVVEISTEVTMNTGWMGRRVMQGAGSGVIISTDGYIMTNNHVIENSSRVRVTLNNGETFEARLVGTDRITDIAVIKIEAKNLTPVIFGNSDGVAMGDLAVAIGNPLGQLGGTATVGIISSLDRQLIIDNKTMTLLQTDAAINQGNSGGGLFNQNGEMIGLVVAKSRGLGIEGLGFAIPVNTAKEVAMKLIESGFVTGRPQIGIVMVDLTATQDVVANGVRFPGIYIRSVESENARQAGLMEGDMLYYIGDARIQSFSDVSEALQQHNVGDTVKVTVVRVDEILEFEVVLSEQRGN